MKAGGAGRSRLHRWWRTSSEGKKGGRGTGEEWVRMGAGGRHRGWKVQVTPLVENIV